MYRLAGAVAGKALLWNGFLDSICAAGAREAALTANIIALAREQGLSR